MLFEVWKQLFQKGFRFRAQMSGKVKKKHSLRPRTEMKHEAGVTFSGSVTIRYTFSHYLQYHYETSRNQSRAFTDHQLQTHQAVPAVNSFLSSLPLH
jgi:hypothetical protein